MAESKKRPRRLKLPENLDLSATVKLVELLSAKRGAALVINASEVIRVGAQCLQILLSAQRTWEADNLSFRIVEPSQPLVDCLSLVGISQSDLNIEVASQ